MGMKRKENRHPLLFWKLSLSFTILIIAMLFMSGITYILTYNALLEQAKKSNMRLAQNAMETVESSLANVTDLASLLNTDQDLVAFLQIAESDRQELIASMSKLQGDLPVIKDFNDLIDGYFLYSMVNRSIIAPQQGFPKSELYYSRYCQYGDWDYDRWEEEVLLTSNYGSLLPSMLMKYGSAQQATLIYLYPVRHPITQRIIGTAFFRINSEQIAALLFPDVSANDNQVFLFNKSGEMLISLNGEDSEAPEGLYQPDRGTTSFQHTINGVPTFVSYCVSEEQDLIFTVATPLSVIQKQSSDVLRAIIISLIVFCGTSMVLASYLFGRQHKQLIRIADRLGKKRQSGWKYDGMRQIDDAVSGLLFDNADLSTKVQEQQSQIRSILLSRLAAGGLPDHAALQKFVCDMDIAIWGSSFRGVYLVFPENQLPVQMQAVLRVIAPYQALLPCACADETNRFLILYQNHEEDDQAVADLFSNVYRTLLDIYQVKTVIYIGYACDDLLYVNKSFESALQMLDIHSSDGLDAHFLYIADKSASSTRYLYSIQEQQKLANLILVSDLEGNDELLEEIYRKNFEQHSLSSSMQKLLYAQLIGTILNCSDAAAPASEMDNLLQVDTPKVFFAQAKKLCRTISLQIRQKSENSTAKNMKEILAYIRENYMHYDLSLSYIALKYHMSESHLSTSIKKHLGQNFQNYVEQLRIDKANELMKSGSLSIQEISEQVGYLSPHSFRRAYKKVMGYTPSQHGSRPAAD